MENLLRGLFFCVILIAYVYIGQCTVTNHTFSKYLSDVEMSSPTMVITAKSVIACASVCAQKEECLSFSYNDITAKCKLNDKDPSKETVEMMNSTGSIVMKKECGDGWVAFESSCYLFSMKHRTWEYSKLYCESQGASLVKVETDDEHQFLRNQANSSFEYFYWIGARYNEDAGQFLWTDGTVVSFNGFYGGSPGSDQRSCLYNRNYDWHWHCKPPVTFSTNSICEKGL